jgi:uncharacterized UBP type Zn finger protein
VDDWVPKKLEIALTFNHDSLSLDSMKGNGITEGEQAMPEAPVEDEVEPELNANLLNVLLQNGVPEIQAKHALYNTGNSDADMAVMWFYENIDNPAIQVPLKVKKAPAGK